MTQTYPASIAGVMTLTPPKSARVAMVFDSPHSGVTLPADFRPAVPPEMVLLATDTHVEDLFGWAPDIGAPLLSAEFPRSFLDLNRSLMDVDQAMLDTPWPYPIRQNASTQRGMGLTWRYAWGDTELHDRLLTVAEMEGRIETYWRPYHMALIALLDETHAEFGAFWHVNCHSMPAIGHALSPDPAGSVRADIVIGDFDGASSEPDFVALVQEKMQGFGYTVSLNQPFRGAELVSAYSNPATGRNSIQIEVNRRLYMDEVTRERTSGHDELRRNLQGLGRAMADYVQDLTPTVRGLGA
ncbi:MAG: N-formylglutamate amidohydrolase [Allorhizobium sp.]